MGDWMRVRRRCKISFDSARKRHIFRLKGEKREGYFLEK